MHVGDIYQFLPTQSFKALQRLKSFITELMQLKMASERDQITATDPNQFITYTPLFLDSSKCENLKRELLGWKK